MNDFDLRFPNLALDTLACKVCRGLPPFTRRAAAVSVALLAARGKIEQHHAKWFMNDLRRHARQCPGSQA